MLLRKIKLLQKIKNEYKNQRLSNTSISLLSKIHEKHPKIFSFNNINEKLYQIENHYIRKFLFKGTKRKRRPVSVQRRAKQRYENPPVVQTFSLTSKDIDDLTYLYAEFLNTYIKDFDLHAKYTPEDSEDEYVITEAQLVERKVTSNSAGPYKKIIHIYDVSSEDEYLENEDEDQIESKPLLKYAEPDADKLLVVHLVPSSITEKKHEKKFEKFKEMLKNPEINVDYKKNQYYYDRVFKLFEDNPGLLNKFKKIYLSTRTDNKILIEFTKQTFRGTKAKSETELKVRPFKPTGLYYQQNFKERGAARNTIYSILTLLQSYSTPSPIEDDKSIFQLIHKDEKTKIHTYKLNDGLNIDELNQEENNIIQKIKAGDFMDLDPEKVTSLLRERGLWFHVFSDYNKGGHLTTVILKNDTLYTIGGGYADNKKTISKGIQKNTKIVGIGGVLHLSDMAVYSPDGVLKGGYIRDPDENEKKFVDASLSKQTITGWGVYDEDIHQRLQKIVNEANTKKQEFEDDDYDDGNTFFIKGTYFTLLSSLAPIMGYRNCSVLGAQIVGGHSDRLSTLLSTPKYQRCGSSPEMLQRLQTFLSKSDRQLESEYEIKENIKKQKELLIKDYKNLKKIKNLEKYKTNKKFKQSIDERLKQLKEGLSEYTDDHILTRVKNKR